ncbi:hypothetical protein ABIB00_005461 [Bradyrhizobium sp. LB14.3]|uniref:hypothetical protein n=1 Tax=Bradyrhizobium sp. LB14.3 TaxID=3156328 RepID=UPI003399283E
MADKPYKKRIDSRLKDWIGCEVRGEELMAEAFHDLNGPIAELFDQSDLDPRYQISWYLLLGMFAEIHYEKKPHPKTWDTFAYLDLLKAAYEQKLLSPGDDLHGICMKLIAKKHPIVDLVNGVKPEKVKNALLRQMYFAMNWAHSRLQQEPTLLKDPEGEAEIRKWLLALKGPGSAPRTKMSKP